MFANYWMQKSYVAPAAAGVTLYIGCSGANLAKSTDDGASWTTNLVGSTDKAMAIYFGGTTGCVGNDTWNLLGGLVGSEGSWAEVLARKIGGLNYDASTGKLWASTIFDWDYGMYLSTDSGSTWTVQTLWNSAWYQNRKSSAVGGVIAISNDWYGTFVSWDDGSTVNQYNTDTTGVETNNHTHALYDGTNMWIAHNNGVSKSANSGSSWTRYTTSQGLINNNSQMVAYDSTRTRVYVASSDATNGGLSYTDNAGSSWSTITLTMSKLLRGVLCKSGTVYAWGDGGLAISTDGGANWTYRTTALPTTDVYGLFVK